MPLSGDEYELVKRALFIIEWLDRHNTFRETTHLQSEADQLSTGLRNLLRLPARGD